NGSDMRTVRGRSLGFFGRPGDGLPASAGELAGNGLPALPAGHTGARPPATAAQLQSAANAASAWADLHASAPMRPGRRAAEAGQSLELTLGDVCNPIGDLEIGGVFAFTWESKDQVRENVRVGRNLNPGVDLLPGTGDDFFNRTQTED